MKRIFLLLLTFAMMLSLTSCALLSDLTDKAEDTGTEATGSTGSGGSVTVNVDNGDKDEELNTNEVINNLETTTYTWATSSSYYIALVVKNNTNYDCSLRADIVLKNADGTVIGAKDGSITAFEKNSEGCIVVQNDEQFASFDYTYSVEKTYLKPVTSSFTCTTSTSPKKVLTTWKNNSASEANLSYAILFFSGDQVVQYGFGYVGDVAAGAEKIDESSFYAYNKTYDSIKIYHNAYETVK